MILRNKIRDGLYGVYRIGGKEVGALACGQRANFFFATQRPRCVARNSIKCLCRQQFLLRTAQSPYHLQTRYRTAPGLKSVAIAKGNPASINALPGAYGIPKK